ncbi:hypothetical protein JMJ35_004336 [Cladonia borealis]|uniref:Uncharacterized protein n=1 Tax=Cladonia borealis TaxID=184061 RepID=A0AA39R3W8_9LECA|nr:hypothetical protein JMJ35_004336 [Cladonia borealis]
MALQEGIPADTTLVVFSGFPIPPSAAASSSTSEYPSFEQLPAAASSSTSAYPSFEQLSAAATTTPAQTSSTTDEVEISTKQDYTSRTLSSKPMVSAVNIQLKPTIVTAQAQPTSFTSLSSTQPTSSLLTFTPATTSPTPPFFTDIVPAMPIPSPGLSSSSKIGIGIGASFGALSLALFVFSIYRYLKHKKRSRQMHAANIPAILPSPPGSAVKEAEKRLATGSQQLGPVGCVANSTLQTPMKESTDGLASLHELGGASAPSTPRELSGVSAVEYARDSGVRSAVGRSELA